MKLYKDFTEDFKQHLVQIFEANPSANIRKLARSLNASPSDVALVLEEAGLETGYISRRALTPDEQLQLLEDYNSGLSYAQLSHKYFISQSTVYSTLSRLEYTPHLRRYISSNTKSKIISLALEGVPVHSISKQLNISYHSIYKFLKSQNVPFSKLNRHLNSDSKSLIIQLYKQGESITSISHSIPCSIGTVYRVLNKAKFDSSDESLFSKYRSGDTPDKASTYH